MENIVSLRAVVEDDLPIMYEQQVDPLATEMAAFPAREREPFMRHWRQIMADEHVVLRTILLDGAIAGNVVSFVQEGVREVGYWIGREYWGRGVATEALRQLLAEVDDRPLFAHVAQHNIGSRRVLEKCGFRLLREGKGFAMEPGGEEVPEYILVLGEAQD